MHKAENYIHTNNKKEKIKEKCQTTEFAHFKRIIGTPKYSISKREINNVFRI